MKKAVIAQDAILLQGAVVMGDVEVGANSSVWYNSVVRGDDGPIRIGENTNIQDGCVLHTDTEMYIGDGVTVGHGCILHGCTVGGNTTVGMGSTVMEAEVGRDCIIGAGSLVTRKTVIPDGSLAFGRPAKVVRPLTEEEIEHNRRSAQHYIQLAKEAPERE